MEKLSRATRKFFVTLLGVSLLLVGSLLLILPGPGIIVIILGLIVLSWEYEWAKHHLLRARKAHKKTLNKIRQRRN